MAHWQDFRSQMEELQRAKLEQEEHLKVANSSQVAFADVSPVYNTLF